MIPDPIGAAVDWVRGEGLLAYPTETVWGLGANARSDAAVERLRSWKQRDASLPLSILIGRPDALSDLGLVLGEAARRLAGALWPGPLTLVLPCSSRFAPGVAREDGAVGVRCSSHPLCASIARRLCAQGVGPITATSLNRHGEQPARTAAEAAQVCTDGELRPRLIEVDGAEAGGDAESTIVDATGEVAQVLRWGSLERDDLESALRGLELR